MTFLEYWKRKNASLAHHWDCMGFQEEDERPRAQFAANAPYLEKNPITGIREPSFPAAVRMRRIAAGSGIILVMVALGLLLFGICMPTCLDILGPHLHSSSYNLQNSCIDLVIQQSDN